MSLLMQQKDAAVVAAAFGVLTLVSAAASAYGTRLVESWYAAYPIAVLGGCFPLLFLVAVTEWIKRREKKLEAKETFTSYPAGFGVTETMDGSQEQPIVVYCYRYPNGVTQVRAPNVTNVHLVLDILAQAEDAARNGTPVTMQ